MYIYIRYANTPLVEIYLRNFALSLRTIYAREKIHWKIYIMIRYRRGFFFNFNILHSVLRDYVAKYMRIRVKRFLSRMSI